MVDIRSQTEVPLVASVASVVSVGGRQLMRVFG